MTKRRVSQRLATEMLRRNIGRLGRGTRLCLVGALLLAVWTFSQERTFAQSVDVPEWAKDVVWYQIFPERFRNGDPQNDPTPKDIRGSWPHLVPPDWRTSDWGGDWYTQTDWERATGQDFYFTCQIRRYGGDLRGMIERLDYLNSLGVNAIYLNPMFESPSLHKYDGSMFHHIDANFGEDPDGDREMFRRESPTDPKTWQLTSADRLFLEFVRQAHRRGIKVVLDGVFNHMGLRSFAFEDVRRNQERSLYKNWFDVTQWDNPATPEDEFKYRGWLNVRELPELNEDEGGLTPAIREYVFAAVGRWMDPNGDGDPSDGIDGWRLDVAEHVKLQFWKAFRHHVRRINPQAYLVGEVWWDDWDQFQMINARPWLNGDAFDAVMNYRWASAARKLFLGADLRPGDSAGPKSFFAELDRLHGDYPAEVNYVLMNTYDSHDTDRLASQVVNPRTQFDHRISPRDSPDYDVRKPNADERRLQRLMLVHQFTAVGAPHILYGDEAGMWGGDDPDDRKPMVWSDRQYADEATHPLGKPRPRDTVEFDHGLFEFYQKLIHLRLTHRALSRGTWTPLHADDESRTLAYERQFGDDRVWVAFNLGLRAHEFDLEIRPRHPAGRHERPPSLSGRNVRDGLTEAVATIQDDSLTFRLEPGTARVWLLEVPATSNANEN